MEAQVERKRKRPEERDRLNGPMWNLASERARNLRLKKDIPISKCCTREYENEEDERLALLELRNMYLQDQLALQKQHLLDFLETVSDEGCELNGKCDCEKCDGVRDIHHQIGLTEVEIVDLEEHEKEGSLDISKLKEN